MFTFIERDGNTVIEAYVERYNYLHGSRFEWVRGRDGVKFLRLGSNLYQWIYPVFYGLRSREIIMLLTNRIGRMALFSYFNLNDWYKIDVIANSLQEANKCLKIRKET